MISLLEGDCLDVLKSLQSCSIQCVVTSPPYYGLRDYGTAKWEGGELNCHHLDIYAKAERERNRKGLANNANAQDGGNRLSTVKNGIDKAWQYKYVCQKCGAKRTDAQIGLEPTPEEYVEKLVVVFREVWRILKDDGTLWLNLGDSYWGGKGQSGTRGANRQEMRFESRVSLNRGYQTLGGHKETRPTDGKHETIKPKDLIGIPWMVAFALRADGWYLRSEIVWQKTNPMPESVRDRPTKSHEKIFLLTKDKKYYYDFQAILEPAQYDGGKVTMMKGSIKYKNGFAPTNKNRNTLHVKGHERWSNKIVGRTEKKMSGTGYGGDGKGLHGHSGYFDADGNLRTHTFEDGIPARNKRDVWTISTKPYKEAHFATFPPALIEPCILAGSKEGDTILDPFNGSGTTGEVALKHNRNYIGCELNPEYIQMTKRRLHRVQSALSLSV